MKHSFKTFCEVLTESSTDMGAVEEVAKLHGVTVDKVLGELGRGQRCELDNFSNAGDAYAAALANLRSDIAFYRPVSVTEAISQPLSQQMLYAWVAPSGKVHPVKVHGHRDWVYDNISTLERGEDEYEHLFGQKWFRLVSDKGSVYLDNESCAGDKEFTNRPNRAQVSIAKDLAIMFNISEVIWTHSINQMTRLVKVH